MVIIAPKAVGRTNTNGQILGPALILSFPAGAEQGGRGGGFPVKESFFYIPLINIVVNHLDSTTEFPKVWEKYLYELRHSYFTAP